MHNIEGSPNLPIAAEKFSPCRTLAETRQTPAGTFLATLYRRRDRFRMKAMLSEAGR
jgi:hypothetical protein